MQAFKFRYENILNLAEKKEDNIKNRLSEAYSDLEKEKDRLHKLKDKELEYSQFIKNETSLGCKLVLLRNIESYRKELNNRISFQNKIVLKRKNEIDSIKKELIEVMKEKKIMEKLKEKKLEDFNIELQRSEEKVVDQLISYKNSLVHR